MKVSDYIAEFLVSLDIKDIFLISGGGMMHLLDSVGRRSELNLVCNLNEQASSICADAYSQYNDNLGVCMLTTGPGGTNAITGIAASYLDSTPVLAISGQCKTADFASLRKVRQYGAQEVDIVSIVNPITKYAVKITDKDSICYHLEKAVYLAKHGRKGPVWLDIPLDIQAAQIEPDKVSHFIPEHEALECQPLDLTSAIEHIYHLFEQAKRPVILIGGGTVLSGAREEIKAFVDAFSIPILATWRAKDVFAEDHPLFFGLPGIPAPRYSNYILQNCDLVFILGSRLNSSLTAYDEPHFAFNAKKIIVDIDPNEINKLDMQFEEKLTVDIRTLLKEMLSQKAGKHMPDFKNWISFCKKMKQQYPLEKEQQPYDTNGLVDGYRLAKAISENSLKTDIWVGSSSGRSCGISHMAVKLKSGQRFISSMGLGSMGFTLPFAIACCLSSGKRRTLAIEGDGSLQHNIQELQLITNYQLPVKLFILSNSGYASIYMMQKNNFKSNFAACNKDTHVLFPLIKDIAECYHIDYYLIEKDEQADEIIKKVMADERPVLCEVTVSLFFDEIPKSMTVVHPDGSFSSSQLENLYPFLEEHEIEANMPSWK